MITDKNVRVKKSNLSKIKAMAQANGVTITVQAPKSRFHSFADLHGNTLDRFHDRDVLQSRSDAANADFVSVVFHKTSKRVVNKIFNMALRPDQLK